jgi:hypothetical protein
MAGWVTARLEIEGMKTQIIEHLSEHLCDLKETIRAVVDDVVQRFRPEEEIYRAVTSELRTLCTNHARRRVQEIFADPNLFQKDIDVLVKNLLNERSRLASAVQRILMYGENTVDPTRTEEDRKNQLQYMQDELADLRKEFPWT